MSLQDAIEEICIREPLFISLVTSLTPVEDNRGCPTMGTDGENLYYNSDFIKTLSDEELCAVILHEVLHCAFRHQWRREDRDAGKWNMAADYAINTIVEESFKLPAGGLVDPKYYGMSAEEIYDSLEDQKTEEQTWCEKDSWEEGEGSSNKQPSVLDKVFGKKKKGTLSGAEKEAKWRELYEENILNNYGKLPGALRRVVDNTHYVPVLDWASLVASLLSEDENDYTFSHPDRRFLDGDIIMPGQFSIDCLKDVIFAYDTSGSIGEDDLRAFYHETLALFENFSSLQGWVAMCDAWLHSFKEADPSRSFEEFDFMGGGGTDFNPVFEEIKKRNMKPKALFYFTDTYGDFPNEEPAYPVFWLVRSRIDENYRLDVPFGQVIRFMGK